MLRFRTRAILAGSLLSLLAACKDTRFTVPNMPPVHNFKSEWLVTGIVANAGYAYGEVLALGLDGTRFHSPIDDRQRFGIELPDNATYAIYFFPSPGVPPDTKNSGSDNIDVIDVGGGRKEVRQPGALLSFDESGDIGLRNSLRLPKVIDTRRLFLGEVDIKGNAAFPTRNPASQLDFDGDGLVDDLDNDDQNDGLVDITQMLKQEQIEICHVTSENSGKTHTVPLSVALPHLLHGDGVGPCRKKRHATSTEAQADEISSAHVAPKPPASPPIPPMPAPDQGVPPNLGNFPVPSHPQTPGHNLPFPGGLPEIEAIDDEEQSEEEEEEEVKEPTPRKRKQPPKKWVRRS